jgi:hypothetical protein
MSRSLIIILLVGTYVVAGSDVCAQSKSKGLKPRYGTIVRYEWPPEKGSPFYKLTRELPRISKIEISQVRSALHPGPLAENETLFRPNIRLHVLATKTVTERDSRNIIRLWRRLNQASSNACDSPAYWLKFYSLDGLVLETVLSFGCRNLVVSGGDWFGFHADGPAGKALLRKLEALFPQSPNKSLDASGGGVFRN